MTQMIYGGARVRIDAATSIAAGNFWPEADAFGETPTAGLWITTSKKIDEPPQHVRVREDQALDIAGLHIEVLEVCLTSKHGPFVRLEITPSTAAPST